MRHIPTLILMAALAPSATMAAEWQMQADASSLGFIGSAQGESFEGVFERFEADIVFDPSDLSNARFDVRIDMTSANTRNSERDETLQTADFFDTRRQPQARYQAEVFRDLGDGRYVAEGELTLRGVTAPVELEFSFDGTDPAILEGEATLDRIAFDVGSGEWSSDRDIRHAVKVVTRLELQRAP